MLMRFLKLICEISNNNCNDDFSDKYSMVVVTSYFDSNFDKKIRPIKKRISYAITMIFTKLPSLPNRVINRYCPPLS